MHEHENVQREPVAAQYRFRHPQRLAQNWSDWQPASISLDRPSWEIDSQGYEVEYRLLYTTPQPVEQANINPNLASDAAKHLTDWLEMGLCECEGVHSCGYYEVERTRDALLVAAEQKPAEQQPAECTLNSGREQATEAEAPSHSLPNWSECNLRVGNSEWLKDNDIKADHDSLTANPLHEFIYEYDDSDAYKSAWFLHRLEKLIDFIRSEQQPAPDVTQLVDALEQVIKAAPSGGPLWHGSEQIVEARAALAAHRKQGRES